MNGVGYTLGYRTGGGITPGMRPDVRRTCAWCRGLRHVCVDAERPKPSPRKPAPPAPPTVGASRPKLVRARDLVKGHGRRADA